MKVINFYGGPGSGKSTMAASVFAELKWLGYNVELAQEFAKDLVWEKRFHTLEDQIYIFGKQHHRIHRLNGQVDFVITDSPLLLSLYYGNLLPMSFYNLVIDSYKNFNNIDIFLQREKEYNPAGRYQTLDEAKEIDTKLKYILDFRAGEYLTFPGNRASIRPIVNAILTDDKVDKERFWEDEPEILG